MNASQPHSGPSSNSKSDSAIAEALQDEATVGYRPVMPLEMLWMSGTDMPQITLRRDIEFMQMHPVVCTAIEYYKSGISGAEFWGGPDPSDPDSEDGKPISQDPRVAKFVLAHVERFWQRGMPVLQEGGYPHGWAPGEHIYKEVEGMLVWSHLKGFHPSDGFILTLNHQAIGLRVKNIRDPLPTDQCEDPKYIHKGGTVDLWFASEQVPAKAAWYPHRPRFNQFYGRSQLIGGWRPWRRLGWRDGAEQVIDAAIYRAGYKGPVVRHPLEDMATAQQGVPATVKDAAGLPRRSARDVARQIVEWAKAGAGFTLSSAKYPQAQGGGNKWDIDWPDHVMDVRPLVEAARYLEDQIMLGIGVPPELVKAGGTGSGYSGRSIPREAFLDGQQRVADAMLQMFVEQVVRPLVRWNFGDVPFDVQCKSLLKTQSNDKQAQPGVGGDPDSGLVDPKRSDAAKRAWELRRKPAEQQPSAPMSVEALPSRVLSIVDKVLGRTSAAFAHAPKGGITIGGKKYKGGEFIPSEELKKATTEQKLKVMTGDRGAGPKVAEYPADLPPHQYVKPGDQERIEQGRAWLRRERVGNQAFDVAYQEAYTQAIAQGFTPLQAAEATWAQANAAQEQALAAYDQALAQAGGGTGG